MSREPRTVIVPLCGFEDGHVLSEPFPESGFFDWPPAIVKDGESFVAVWTRLPNPTQREMMTILIEDPDVWKSLPSGARVRRTQAELADIKSRPGRAEEDEIIRRAIEILDRRQAEGER